MRPTLDDCGIGDDRCHRALPCAALEVLRHACGARTDDVVLGARRLGVDTAVTIGLFHRAVPADALRAPVIQRIERDAPTIDPRVTSVWSSEDTIARLSE